MLNTIAIKGMAGKESQFTHAMYHKGINCNVGNFS
jgi:hypothetical protein